MLPPPECLKLLQPETSCSPMARAVLEDVGFDRPELAIQRLRNCFSSSRQREMLAEILPTLLHSFHEAADPSSALLNFERFFHAHPDRDALLALLRDDPRAIEVMVRLFVGSQFLTETLIRAPLTLEQLTNHRRLAEFKSREDFLEQGRMQCLAAEVTGASQALDVLPRFQQWEVLRVAACDSFGLLDLKTVTRQLSLLADALVQLVLEYVAADEGVSLDKFVVFAFGKLGGEELNYSSDIDLVFVCKEQPERYLKMAQRLVRALTDVTSHGFLYRVDMRLRPWGRSGSLVTTAEAYKEYVEKHAQLWERQALLKARPIAGDLPFGDVVLKQVRPSQFEADADAIWKNVWDMKSKVEAGLDRRGEAWRDVKGGPGGIRDIEFLTQGLQLEHGGSNPAICSRGTLEGLARLTDFEVLMPGEFRRLSIAYSFLRTIEHALQLLHNRQEHALPSSPRALNYLARRLDYPDEATFLDHYRRHTTEVRKIFLAHVHPEAVEEPARPSTEPLAEDHFGGAAAAYHEIFGEAEEKRQLQLLRELKDDVPVRILSRQVASQQFEVTLVGYDRPGELSVMCGLLFAYGFDIQRGHVFTGGDVPRVGRTSRKRGGTQRKFVNSFLVRHQHPNRVSAEIWEHYERELLDLLGQEGKTRLPQMQARLVARVASQLRSLPDATENLVPVEIEVDTHSDDSVTLLRIRGEDNPGFLYELTNALAMAGLSIVRMHIQTIGHQAIDVLHVVDEKGRKLTNPQRLQQLRATVALIQHFIHLLPQATNPETALLQFRELLERLLARPDWSLDLSRLDDSNVLRTLTKLLGVSEFLWQDFLKLQHENLFPVLTDSRRLQQARDRDELAAELKQELQGVDFEEQRRRLNSFKDREILRVDLRHIMGLQDRFGMFSRELTALADATVDAALQICWSELAQRHGIPRTATGEPARISVCGLGKYGGEEMGYASDLELMFIYEGEGRTDGRTAIANHEFFERLVDAFRRTIHAGHKKVFDLDLRLRPYGSAGSLAVSLPLFLKYFGPDGPAWPYERQALVKLRRVAGDAALGAAIQQHRDELIYRNQPFDVAAMRAMREKQLRQLVRADAFNAKLGSGGVVDCEYLVQGLQITYGHLGPELRVANTREALKALEKYEIVTPTQRKQLRDGYRFMRRLIDALRMVRGDASDLDVPPNGTEEFDFLARRLNYADPAQLRAEIELYSHQTAQLSHELLETIDTSSAMFESDSL